MNSLLQIADLRAGKCGAPALREGVFSEDSFVARYCVKRMLARPSDEIERRYVSRLRRLRDNHAADPQACLLCSRLANNIERKPANSDDEYLWLRKSVVKWKEDDWRQLRFVVLRLLEFEHRRSENVAFLAWVFRAP